MLDFLHSTLTRPHGSQMHLQSATAPERRKKLSTSLLHRSHVRLFTAVVQERFVLSPPGMSFQFFSSSSRSVHFDMFSNTARLQVGVDRHAVGAQTRGQLSIRFVKEAQLLEVIAMASNLLAMASNLLNGLPPTSDGLQPTSNGFSNYKIV